MSTTAPIPKAAAAPLFSCEQKIDTSPEKFGWLHESHFDGENAAELRACVQRDGYLFLRGLLDRERVRDARKDALARLVETGIVNRDFPVEDGIAAPGVSSRMAPDVAKANLPLQEILYSGPAIRFFEAFWEHEILHFDYTWFRAVSPGRGTSPHCDIVYMGRGTKNLMTMWTPLGDITTDIGGLIVLEDSHRKSDRIRRYLERDVDVYCANRKNADAYASGEKKWNGALSLKPVTLLDKLGGRWLTAREYRMGDVVVFPMHTVHGSLDNRSDKIRLSTDTRYQRSDEPADERWVGPNPPGHGSAGKRGRIC